MQQTPSGEPRASLRAARATALLVLAGLLAGCGGAAPKTSERPSPTGAPSPSATGRVPTASPSPSGSPQAARDGVEGLVADLQNAGAKVSVGAAFKADPIARQGVTVCIGREEIRVYTYATPQERMAVASTINPNDATHVGASIVEWDGAPKFWQRDRILVLYLGRNAATTALLVSVLGSSFAHGQDHPQRMPSACPG